MDVEVRENSAQRRFEMALDDGAVAAIYYRIDDEGRLVLIHTEVPSEYSGRGIATRLATSSLNLIRQSGRKAVFQCPFLANFLAKHPEYGDLVA
jgi:hypothetical protein